MYISILANIRILQRMRQIPWIWYNGFPFNIKQHWFVFMFAWEKEGRCVFSLYGIFSALLLLDLRPHILLTKGFTFCQGQKNLHTSTAVTHTKAHVHTHTKRSWTMCCGSLLGGVKVGHEKPQQCHSSMSRKRTARPSDRETLTNNEEKRQREWGGWC